MNDRYKAEAMDANHPKNALIQDQPKSSSLGVISANISSTSDFATKGICGPQGLLVELNSSQTPTAHSSSSITTPSERAHFSKENKIQDGNYRQYGPLKKRKLRTDCLVDKTSSVATETEKPAADRGVVCVAKSVVPVNVDVVPISPKKKVLEIENIVEVIFSLLDRKSLLECRSVCYQWAVVCSKQLTKVNTVRLKERSSYNPAERASTYTYTHRAHPRLSIEDLASVMENSFYFPSNSFSFDGTERIGMLAAQYFLDNHGLYMKKLVLSGTMYFEDLKRLLLIQAPNIVNLFLQVDILFAKSPWYSYGSSCIQKKEANNGNNGTSKYVPYDDKNKTFLTKTNANHQFKLKVLDIYNNFPKKNLLQLLQCSPHLSCLRLPSSLTKSYATCLVKPVNYLPLFKHFKIEPKENNINSLEFLANRLPEDNWTLESLKVKSASLIMLQHLWERSADVISKILMSCSLSCTKIHWTQLGFLSGLHIPQMCSVQEITLLYWQQYPGSQIVDPSPTLFFPRQTSLAEKFPNLKSVYIFGHTHMKKLYIDISFLFDNCEPVTSVTKVFLSKLLHCKKKLRRRLKEMFPNAVFT